MKNTILNIAGISKEDNRPDRQTKHIHTTPSLINKNKPFNTVSAHLSINIKQLQEKQSSAPRSKA